MQFNYQAHYYNSDARRDGNHYASQVLYNKVDGEDIYRQGIIRVNDNVLIKVIAVEKNKKGVPTAVVQQYVWSRDGNIYMRTIVLPYKELWTIVKPPYLPLLVDFN